GNYKSQGASSPRGGRGGPGRGGAGRERRLGHAPAAVAARGRSCHGAAVAARPQAGPSPPLAGWSSATACSCRLGTTAPPPAARSSAPPRELLQENLLPLLQPHLKEAGKRGGRGSGWLCQCPCPLPGTRIIYDRKFLMECRNSPVTKTPPRDLPTIPGVTSPASDEPPTEASQNHLRNSPEDKPAGGEESQFEMDI
uniref:Eukaryotic translation initiation factor 4E binding protein 1 n=1 Tax=Equus caballus TaxID=9796 RepID=A0A3Q2HCV3_HORSE